MRCAPPRDTSARPPAPTHVETREPRDRCDAAPQLHPCAVRTPRPQLLRAGHGTRPRARRRGLRLAAAWLACALAAAVAPSFARAQNLGLVVRDGSLGRAPAGVVAPGLDPLGQPASYLIAPELGEQRGGNLFHSFTRFGIGSGESATFTGPDPLTGPQSVRNVISRVSGGDASRIQGTLRSTIPGADVYLVNPAGVIFEPGARLDVQGAFRASTADALRLGDGGMLFSDPTAESVLTAAAPTAFGFLANGQPFEIANEPPPVSAPEPLLPGGGEARIVSGVFFVAAPERDKAARPSDNAPRRVFDATLPRRDARLPDAFRDPTELLRGACPARRAVRAASFVVAAHGGLPPSPDAALPSGSAPGHSWAPPRVDAVALAAVTPHPWIAAAPSHCGD